MRSLRLTFLAVVALLALGSLPARAQNPFVGTWSTSFVSPRGGGFAAYFDFYPNGAFHMSGVVTGGGYVLHAWGSYRFDSRRAQLQYVYRSYAPVRCVMGFCEPPLVPLNQPIMLQYRFPNRNMLLLSDASRWVRQRSNPFPSPR